MATAIDKEQLVSALQLDGSAIGNKSLMTSLGWTAEKYWEVRDLLIADGRVERGRGRGGSVHLVLAADAVEFIPAPADEVAKIVEAYEKELELYEPMRKVLSTDWARERGAAPIAVEVTAQQGRRPTGGRWSRPDIIAVEVRTFIYVPGKFLTVTTFEVKSSDAIDVTAVYEALAHRRSATHSYVLLHVPDLAAKDLASEIEEIRIVARAHGVGVLVAANPADYGTWEELEEAVRHDPDPERLELLISTQLESATAAAVARSLR